MQTQTGNVPDKTLTMIQLLPSAPSIAKGTTVQLSAIGFYSDGTQVNMTSKVSWQSREPAIVAVSSVGSVRAKALGSAHVEATYQGVTGQDRVTVTVPSLLSLEVLPNKVAVPVGISEQLHALGTFTDGTTQDVTANVTWSSSAAGVARVSNTGLTVGSGTGTAKIAAASGNIASVANVTVTPPLLVSISITPSHVSIPLGDSQQLHASGVFSDGSAEDLTATSSWNSSGTAIADVDEVGETVARGMGTATIVAISGEVSGTAIVTVTPAVPLGIAVIPDSVSIPIGSSQQFQAVATFTDGSSQDVTSVVQWNSQSAVASIGSGGLALGEQSGSTAITATGLSLTGSANVTVVPAVLANYFDLHDAQVSNSDDTIRLTNPGFAGDRLCAMLYVFDEKQNMAECCGCIVGDSGLRTLSLKADVTSNPLNGQKPAAGVIKVVASDTSTNPECNPGSLSPQGTLLGWTTHVTPLPGATFRSTETRFASSPLSAVESQELVASCGFIQTLGSGQGICTCGSP